MFKAVNKQTREVRTGSFEDLCDLDKRLWKLSEGFKIDPTVPQSHNPNLNRTALCKVFTYNTNADTAYLGISHIPDWYPVYSIRQFEGRA